MVPNIPNVDTKKFLIDFVGLNLSEIDDIAEQTLEKNDLKTYYEKMRPGPVLKHEEKLNLLKYSQVEPEEEDTYAADNIIKV